MGAGESTAASAATGTNVFNRCCTPGTGAPTVDTESKKSDPNRIWTEEVAKISGPIIAIAVHHGHAVHPEALKQMQISEVNRLIEEDPYTGEWTFVGHFRAVATHSRFEVDLNRPRDKCIYTTPADSWNLKVWKDEKVGPSADVVAKCLAFYDHFYAKLRRVCEELEAEHGAFVLLDIHSYNHRRAGPNAKADDQAMNPDINVGTSNMDRSNRWAPLVRRFMKDMARGASNLSKSSVTDFAGGAADVRENIRFKGGEICKWIHINFPKSGVALALEFKKFWMDEWTGMKDQLLVDEIGKALQSTIPGLMEEVAKVGKTNRDSKSAAAATETATATATAPAPAPAPAQAAVSLPSAASIVISSPATGTTSATATAVAGSTDSASDHKSDEKHAVPVAATVVSIVPDGVASPSKPAVSSGSGITIEPTPKL